MRPGRADARSAAELGELLAYADPDGDEGRRSRVLRVVLLPVALAGGAYALACHFYSSMLVDPVLRRGWRARKRLADATAVELTRHPDALARAFVTLASHAGFPPGASWASHLFVVGPEAEAARSAAILRHRLTAAQGAAPGGFFADEEATTAFAALAEAGKAATFHPPIGDRISALRRLGASVETTPWSAMPRRRSRAVSVLVAPLRLLGFVFHLAVPIFGMAVALSLGLIYVAPVTLLLHQFLRSLA